MTAKRSGLSDQVETSVLEPGEIGQENAAAEVGADVGDSAQALKTKTRQKSYVMDLRIHSPASLGYLGVEGLDTAPALVRLAKVKGLDVIGVTDFYSGKFIDRVVDAARGTALTVVPGVVIRAAIPSCNDIILTCLFPECYSGARIEDFLKEIKVPESAFGSRSFCVTVSLQEILRVVDAHQAVAMPSRMDKTPYRLAAIPMLVEQYGFRAFDLAYADSLRFFKRRWPKEKFQLFSFSNANALAQVGSRIAKIKMPIPGFDGIRQVVSRQALIDS